MAEAGEKTIESEKGISGSVTAEPVVARKKRKLSEAHKAKLAEANQAYRFKPKLDASETPKTAQI